MSGHTQWYKLAESVNEIEFNNNGLAEVEVNGKNITLALHNGKVFACPQKCPHAGGTLANGYIDVLGNIVCPVHHYKYSLLNGYNISGEGYHLKTYKVDVREDGIFIALL